jgi:GxxExxY protein
MEPQLKSDFATDGAQMDADTEQVNSITERIIGDAYRVHNALGCGFLEKVYENAMSHELGKMGLRVGQQVGMKVWYDGIVVGDYVANLLVEDLLIVELKAVKSIDPIHLAQAINYLAATHMPICLVVNFEQRVQVKRIVHSRRQERG